MIYIRFRVFESTRTIKTNENNFNTIKAILTTVAFIKTLLAFIHPCGCEIVKV